MKSGKTALKYLLAAGIVLVCVVVIATAPRTRSGRKASPPDPMADVVKNFLRSRLDVKYADPAFGASPEGKQKLQEWSNQLKREYTGAYVPKYGAPAVARDPRNERRVDIEDISIEEILPLGVTPITPLRYEVSCSLEISSQPINFRTKYFVATVTLVQQGRRTYVADFVVNRFSEWAPWSPQGQEEQKRLESASP